MTNTLRLIFPEWQGGCTPTIREGLNNKFNNKDTMLGYSLGSHIVNLLVPPSKGPKDCTVEVPISQEFDGETFNIENHIYQRQSIIKNNQNALSILKEKNPSHVIVIGGECSVSFTPFKYMIEKYG